MSTVTYDYLNIRSSPDTSSNSNIVGRYERGDRINSIYRKFEGGDGRIWAVYRGGQTGVDRYVCYRDNARNGYTQYLDP